MANPDHVRLLLQGSQLWNAWVSEHTTVVRPYGFEVEIQKNVARGEFVVAQRVRPTIDLVRADLENADLAGTDLRSANLYGANLRGVDLTEADLSDATLDDAILHTANLTKTKLQGTSLMGCAAHGATFQGVFGERAKFNGGTFIESDFTGADLSNTNLYRASFSNAIFRKSVLDGANLQQARLQRADLSDAQLVGADLSQADLTEAKLIGADLERVILVNTIIEGAEFDGAHVYGISVWAVKGTPKTQTGLSIASYDDNEAEVTVDDLDVAQFIYLLLRREKLRNVINTITSKAVLILGRFTPERKLILDAIAQELRTNHLLPIVFDFEKATDRDLTETIKVLAGLSLFVIADVSNPKSAPLELQATVPDYQIPFVIILQEGEEAFAMLDGFKKYDWVLKPVLTYPSSEMLRKAFKTAILEPAWVKHLELRKEKTERMNVRSVEDFIRNG